MEKNTICKDPTVIRLQRNRDDDNGNTIKPNDAWFKLSSVETKIALKEKNKHIFSEACYKAPQVRIALEKLFHQKCAYCEFDLRRVQWEVEHFRPIRRVKERKNHPGYYWLAYIWENLYSSCTYCNQHRLARPRWGKKGKQFAGGKANQFPVDEEKTRAIVPADDLKREKRLLLDPCEDDPEKYLGYEWDGQIYPLRNSRKGKESIRIFNLKETRLCEARADKIDCVVEIIKNTRKATEQGDHADAKRWEDFLEKHFLGENTNFAGASRFVVKNPENFGIE